MQKYQPYAVLLLRLALAATLLATVSDKLGYWGEPGITGVLFGNWDRYADYTAKLLFLLPSGIADKVAVVFTLLEIVFALMLLVGLKVRWAAIGLAVYFLVLAILMVASGSVKELFNQAIVVTAAAALLLACCPVYRFTLHGVKKRSSNYPF